MHGSILKSHIDELKQAGMEFVPTIVGRTAQGQGQRNGPSKLAIKTGHETCQVLAYINRYQRAVAEFAPPTWYRSANARCVNFGDQTLLCCVRDRLGCRLYAAQIGIHRHVEPTVRPDFTVAGTLVGDQASD